MICSTLSGKLAIKHPTLNILVREDGLVFNKDQMHHRGYAWNKGSLDQKTEHNKNGGYYRTMVNRKKYRVHRLVAECFIPNPANKPFIDHINRIRGDNRVSNLRWVTQKENIDNSLIVLNRNPLINVRHCDNEKEYSKQYKRLQRRKAKEISKHHA